MEFSITPNKTLRIAESLLSKIVMLIFLVSLSILYKSYVLGEEAFFFNYKPVLEQSGNLKPVINKNDVVIVKRQDEISDFKEGEYILFKSNEYQTSIEEITRFTEDGMKTKKSSGESLGFITDKDVLGKGIYVLETSKIIQNPLKSVSIVAIIILAIIFIDKGIEYIIRRKKYEVYNE